MAPVANGGARPRRGTMTLTADVAAASEVYDEIDQLLLMGGGGPGTAAVERERERLQAELAETRRQREAARRTARGAARAPRLCGRARPARRAA